MDAAGPPSPAAALVAVALVWALLRGTGAARGSPEADAALLGSVALACAVLLALRPERARSRGSGARERARRLGGLALAALAGFASFPLWLALVGAAGGALRLGAPPALRPPGPALALVQLGLGPLLEELLYRECVLGALRGPLGATGAVVASSALFALAHPEPWSALGALGVGLALGTFVATTGALRHAVAAHAGLNLAACVWLRA